MINLNPSVSISYERTGKEGTRFEACIGDKIDSFLDDYEAYDLFLNSHLVTCERNYKLKEGDSVFAIHRPHGADPVTIGIAIAVITAIVTIALLPRPEKPNQQGIARTSPNNQISGQTNVARTGEGVPDIKGQIRAYPDLAQSAWYSWEENRRRVRERFCVGISTLDITDVRDNETEFSRIAGSSFEVVERAVNGTDRYPLRATSLDDSRLLAENQREIDLNYIYLANDGGINYVIVGVDPNQDIPVLLDLDNEASFEISGTTSATINQEFFIDHSNPITTSTEVVSVTFSPQGQPVDIELQCHRIPVIVEDDFPAYSLGSCTIRQGSTCFPDFIVIGYNAISGAFFDIGEIRVGEITDGFTNWTQLGVEGVGSFSWYLNLIFQSGLIMSSGNLLTVSFQIQARDSVTQDPATLTALINGQPVAIGSDVSVDITGRTRAELGRTIEFTQTQPNISNRVEFRVRRTTDIDPENTISDASIETVFSLIRYPSTALGAGFTLIDVDARSDFTNNSTSSRKINCLAARRQHSYDIATDAITAPSSLNRSFADGITSDFMTLFGETRTRQILDLVSLYTVSDALSDDLKNFGYSFDDVNISLGQRIHTMCNVARVGAIRDGQVWRFYREEAKSEVYVFDRRNIASTSDQSQSYRFQKPNDNDSVRLSYIDPVDDKERHIERRIDAANQTFVEGVGNRPLEISLAGCRNTAQAINRAELEVRRLLFQRRRVTERVLNDGQIVDIGDRVRWACIYDDDTTDGEALEISGTQVRLSERPVFEAGSTYFAHISDSNGNMTGPHQVTQGSLGDFWIEGLPVANIFIANNMPSQAGSHVIIGTTNDLNYYDFTITSKTPADDETVQIEMVEYDARMFSED